MAIRRRKLRDGKTWSYNAEVYVGQRPSSRTGKLMNAYDRATFATKGEAQDWIANHRVARNKNPNHNPRAHERPFADVVALWRETRLPGMSPKSRDRYEQVLRRHLMPEFGADSVGALTRERVERYFGRLRSTELAYGTVKKIHTTLSSIMSTAVRHNLIDVNPAARLDALRRDDYEEPRGLLILTAQEVHALADAVAAKHAPYRALILTAAFTGLRAGELHALRRRDVNLLRGELTVNRALKVWRAGAPVYGRTKTGKRRTVVLCDEIRDLLAAHMAPLHSTPGGAPDDLVFTSQRGGGAIHQVAFLRNHFKPAREAVLPDHPNLRMHDLRHTFVSLLIQRGVSVKAIASQTGHTSAAMVLDTYGHLYPGDEERVREALSAAFSGATANVIPIRREADAS